MCLSSPIEAELDLKKAARAVGRKVCGNAPCQRDHNCDRVCTGRLYRDRYEKAFPTTIQENAQTLDYIYVSGGKLECS